ncbi:efflux RND transporter periplasmic adaptor subunit [Aquincola sp. S2]|uniref:Efflux RND transporter periplasmic adaptor subunit n=1 Tax=Pseudaquabacterium terrae TaxID=2732868 RepID=A0ABX2EEJ9_9BURK|nr:efflux RND transporter periplasmic adaptor subunit [Aquabacterium terrae]NRF67030.1 efflux RND transporter periplasmic adaptor subunit [Aquabacterium terrae]
MRWPFKNPDSLLPGPLAAVPRRHVIGTAAVLLMGAGAAGWLVSAHSGETDDVQSRKQVAASHAAALPASLTVQVLTPQRQTIARGLAATGSVAARDELIVGSDASGVRLLEVRVEVGSVVKKGDLLARADDAQLLAQLAQSAAQIKAAEVELRQAEANLERAERVEESGLYSVEAVQTRRTAMQAAAAKLELTQAQRRELDVKLAQTRVLAPADGVIAKRAATVGAVLQPGIELFRLIRDQQLDWLAELPSHALAQVRPGVAVQLLLDDGRTLSAAVRLVAPTLDAGSRNGLVHVALPAAAGLKAGSHARGEILVGEARVLTLPDSVLLMRDGQPHVFELGSDSIARLKRIETGLRQRGLIEVTAGLTESSRVVGTGAGFVKDGERVQVAPAPQASAQVTGVPGGPRT